MAQRPRKDVLRNNRAILRATGELLQEDPSAVTIAAVAERAGLSVPTVYRYYASAEALLGRYMLEVLEELRDFSHDCDAPGVELFDRVLEEWGRLVDEYGAGLAQLRSRRGLLERLHAGDAQIATQRDAWERPLRRVMRAEGIDDALFENVLFLYNQMFDPRELRDLRGQGLAMNEAIALMRPAFLAAVHRWGTDGARPL